VLDVFEMVDISLSDKGKSDILQKFGEYTPESIKKYFMEEKGVPESEADQAANVIKSAAKPDTFNKVWPWAVGGIAALFLIRAMGKRR